ncbi:hypothetical protein STRNTR1_2541 [Stenotrophomonas maltophilia]|nr:hypothetical protein STRNTR1_2541 [Stenotrophomonas maltophilia]
MHARQRGGRPLGLRAQCLEILRRQATGLRHCGTEARRVDPQYYV